MSRELRENGFLLPAFTSYNGGDIPFGYPPLGLYLNALLGPLFGPGQESLRYLPLLVTCMTIPAFWFMVRPWVTSPIAAMTTLAWAVIPRSWMWQVTGGGITRSLGMLFAFLAIGCVIRLLQTSDRRWWILAPLFCGLTLLSHLESAAFVAVTLAVAWVAHDRSARSFRRLALVAILGVIVASPWIIAVLAGHGIGPLTSAGGSRLAFMNIALSILVSLRWTSERFIEIGALLGIIGLGLTIATGRWWLAAWIVAIFAVLPGGAATYSMVPWAFLVVAAISTLVTVAIPRRAMRIGTALLVLGLAASIWARYDPLIPLTSLSPSQREAMLWVARETPPDSRFLVVTGAYWPLDATCRVVPCACVACIGRDRAGPGVHDSGRMGAQRPRSGRAVELRYSHRRLPRRLGTAVERSIRLRGSPDGATPGVESEACCESLVAALDADGRFASQTGGDGARIYAISP